MGAILVPLTAACIFSAAQAFSLPPMAMATLLKTEGGRVGECVRQTNGFLDCGPAQIDANIWVPFLAKGLNWDMATTFSEIKNNGCFNVMVGAFILSEKITEARGNLWDGMGRYNSATPSIKYAYSLRLMKSLRTLEATNNRAQPPE